MSGTRLNVVEPIMAFNYISVLCQKSEFHTSDRKTLVNQCSPSCYACCCCCSHSMLLQKHVIIILLWMVGSSST